MATTIASTGDGAGGIAADGTGVYWAETFDPAGDLVRRLSVNGGPVATIADGQSDIQGVAVDTANVHWTSAMAIMKAPKVGGDAVTVSLRCDGMSLALDESSGYWTKYTSNTVRSVPVDGGASTTFASGSSAFFASAIAVDSTSVYWMSMDQSSGDYRILKKDNASMMSASSK